MCWLFLLSASKRRGIRTRGERVLSFVGRQSEKESDDKRDLRERLAAGLDKCAPPITGRSEGGNPCPRANLDKKYILQYIFLIVNLIVEL